MNDYFTISCYYFSSFVSRISLLIRNSRNMSAAAQSFGDTIAEVIHILIEFLNRLVIENVCK